MKIGIFQPGKIGDIIICLPIAKYYADRGYNIVWPVQKNIISQFINVVDYVKFVEFEKYEDFILKYDCNFILDLCFNIYGNEIFTRLYNQQNIYTFDELKYKIANVDFEEKWKLNIHRNIDDELYVFNNVVKNEKYIVCHTNNTRGGQIKFKDDLSNHQIIHIDQMQDGKTGVFSWLTIIERASQVILSNSCFLNLVNQLNINEENRVYFKNAPKNVLEKEHPKIKGKWRII